MGVFVALPTSAASSHAIASERLKGNPRSLIVLASILVGVVFSCAAARGNEEARTREQLEFLEKQVRPLLAKHCYQCHGVNAKRLAAKLPLDSRKGHLRGGDSGPAIVPGDAEGSLLEEIAAMVPHRPWEEPMILPFGKNYVGRGIANMGAAVHVRILTLVYVQAAGVGVSRIRSRLRLAVKRISRRDPESDSTKPPQPSADP